MHAHLRANGAPEWISTEWLMALLIAHGVTGVRDMNSDCDGPSQGPVCLDRMREWQTQIEDGTLLGPRLLALSSWIVNPPWNYEVTEEQARTVARMFTEQGLDFIKVYDRLQAAPFRWLMDEANGLDIEVAGHVPLRVTSAQASNAGLRSVEHARAFLFDCSPGSAEFRRTALFAGDSAFRSDPRNRYIPAPIKADWIRDADAVVACDSSPAGRKAYMDFYRKGLEITGVAHDAGVGVLLGTDGGDGFVFPGSSAHDELGELVAAGLSPAEALRAGTWSGAEFLGLTERYGSVEAGKRADLVLLSENPLEDIDNVRTIRAVIFGGRHLDRVRLDALLRQAEATADRASEGGEGS